LDEIIAQEHALTQKLLPVPVPHMADSQPKKKLRVMEVSDNGKVNEVITKKAV
jgi:hypothetical protein